MQLSGPMVCQSKHRNPVCGLAVVKVILPNGFPIEQCNDLNNDLVFDLIFGNPSCIFEIPQNPACNEQLDHIT